MSRPRVSRGVKVLAIAVLLLVIAFSATLAEWEDNGVRQGETQVAKATFSVLSQTPGQQDQG